MDAYDTLELLGKGTTGAVHKLRRRNDDELFVVKRITLTGFSKQHQREMLNEARLMSSVSHHPSIIEYVDSFVADDTLHIVMELAAGGDLAHVIRAQGTTPLSEEQIWALLIQVTTGLRHLHAARILHRDIKAENVFIDGAGRVKIGDLGLGRMLDGRTAHARTTVGTPLYFSPEMCDEKPYNEKSDIWALGCLVYELCTFRPPFVASNQLALARKILHAQPPPLPQTYSMELAFLTAKMLEKDPNARPSAAQVLEYTPVRQRFESVQALLEGVAGEHSLTPPPQPSWAANPAAAEEPERIATAGPTSATLPAAVARSGSAGGSAAGDDSQRISADQACNASADKAMRSSWFGNFGGVLGSWFGGAGRPSESHGDSPDSEARATLQRAKEEEGWKAMAKAEEPAAGTLEAIPAHSGRSDGTAPPPLSPPAAKTPMSARASAVLSPRSGGPATNDATPPRRRAPLASSPAAQPDFSSTRSHAEAPSEEAPPAGEPEARDERVTYARPRRVRAWQLDGLRREAEELRGALAREQESGDALRRQCAAYRSRATQQARELESVRHAHRAELAQAEQEVVKARSESASLRKQLGMQNRALSEVVAYRSELEARLHRAELLIADVDARCVELRIEGARAGELASEAAQLASRLPLPRLASDSPPPPLPPRAEAATVVTAAVPVETAGQQRAAIDAVDDAAPPLAAEGEAPPSTKTPPMRTATTSEAPPSIERFLVSAESFLTTSEPTSSAFTFQLPPTISGAGSRSGSPVPFVAACDDVLPTPSPATSAVGARDDSIAYLRASSPAQIVSHIWAAADASGSTAVNGDDAGDDHADGVLDSRLRGSHTQRRLRAYRRAAQRPGPFRSSREGGLRSAPDTPFHSVRPARGADSSDASPSATLPQLVGRALQLSLPADAPPTPESLNVLYAWRREGLHLPTDLYAPTEALAAVPWLNSSSAWPNRQRAVCIRGSGALCLLIRSHALSAPPFPGAAAVAMPRAVRVRYRHDDQFRSLRLPAPLPLPRPGPGARGEWLLLDLPPSVTRHREIVEFTLDIQAPQLVDEVFAIVHSPALVRIAILHARADARRASADAMGSIHVSPRTGAGLPAPLPTVGLHGAGSTAHLTAKSADARGSATFGRLFHSADVASPPGHVILSPEAPAGVLARTAAAQAPSPTSQPIARSSGDAPTAPAMPDSRAASRRFHERLEREGAKMDSGTFVQLSAAGGDNIGETDHDFVLELRRLRAQVKAIESA